MVYLSHMAWTARYRPDLEAVETLFAGFVNRAELLAAVAETQQLLAQHCGQGLQRVLGDCSTLQGGQSLADLYFLAERLAASGIGATLREAVLVAPGALADSVLFWEDACRNRGLTVRVFDDRVLAERWLQDQVDSH